MKKILILTAAAAAGLLALVSCRNAQEGDKVMARYVPERADDFVWENDLVAYRAYGKALEGNPTSPGFDVWVKKAGKLVADEWYKGAMEDPDYYHHDHGGKDCYKVAVSLGGGASSPVVNGQIAYPPTNYRDYRIIEDTPEKVVFELVYPAWAAGEDSVALTKRITVTPGTQFCKAEDIYAGTFDSLTVAAGIIRHEVLGSSAGDNFVVIWEKASDQSIEPEEGQLGLAVYMPDADKAELESIGGHALVFKTITPGQPITYWFGSCWSRGDRIATSEAWNAYVQEFIASLQ